jgi:phosphatidylglycerophosphate synthase
MFDRIGRRLIAPAVNRVALLVPNRITPSAVTGFGLLAGIGCALSASQGWIVASLLLWTVNRLADGLDGALARLPELFRWAPSSLRFESYQWVPIQPASQIGNPKSQNRPGRETVAGLDYPTLDPSSLGAATPGLHVQSSTRDLGGYLDLMADFVTYASVPIGIAWRTDNRGTWISLALLLGAFYVNLGSWSVLSAIHEKRGRGAATTESTSITMPSAIVEGTETIIAYATFLLFPSASRALFASFALLVALSTLQRIQWAIRNL